MAAKERELAERAGKHEAELAALRATLTSDMERERAAKEQEWKRREEELRAKEARRRKAWQGPVGDDPHAVEDVDDKKRGILDRHMKNVEGFEAVMVRISTPAHRSLRVLSVRFVLRTRAMLVFCRCKARARGRGALCRPCARGPRDVVRRGPSS